VTPQEFIHGIRHRSSLPQLWSRQIKALALSKRAEHNIETASLNLRTIQRIYKSERRIRIDTWDIKGSRIRAAYFRDNDDNSVAVRHIKSERGGILENAKGNL
jgi:hypothetical protein